MSKKTDVKAFHDDLHDIMDGAGTMKDTEIAEAFVAKGWRKRSEGEWISVEEMVPGGNGVFLVALKESGYENLVYFDVRRYEDGEWRNIPDKLTVSHWMPLPEPPKGE